ncbi:MAG TPA: radical SAM protein [Papillibacter sp.]|jgi:histone acetyltransferase (RNA polymerase elongator complex component)|nr:radical SAM protein [Papillibacter sp.]
MTPRRRVIPVFVPHLGCPNACVFCSQRLISGTESVPTPETVRTAVETALKSVPDNGTFQIAFYGGSFTAVPQPLQDALLGAAVPFLSRRKGTGIRISTRPDCIDEETVARLKAAGVQTIELGAQSLSDDVLALSGRGHSREDTIRAAGIIRKAGMELILQMMTGLPGDTPERAMETAHGLIALAPQGVRIYPAVVLRGTELETMWRRGAYKAHTVEDAVSICARLYEMFEQAGIPVIRLGLHASESLGADVVAGAYHPALGELVLSRVLFRRAVAQIHAVAIEKPRRLVLGVHPSRVSAMAGQKRQNIRALEEMLHCRVTVSGTEKAQAGDVLLLEVEK